MSDSELWVPCRTAFDQIAHYIASACEIDFYNARLVAAVLMSQAARHGEIGARAKHYYFDHSEDESEEPRDILHNAIRVDDPDYIKRHGTGIIPAAWWGREGLCLGEIFYSKGWLSGDFDEQCQKAEGVEFELTGWKATNFREAVRQLTSPAAREVQRPLRSPPAAIWWPAFAEELAMFILELGIPEGQGAEGQSKVIEEIQTRLTKAGRPAPTRTQVQSVITRILRRWRGEVLDNPINEGAD